MKNVIAEPSIHHAFKGDLWFRQDSEEDGRKGGCRGWNFSVGTLPRGEGFVMVGSTSESTPLFLSIFFSLSKQ
jgi:hypothetical protein